MVPSGVYRYGMPTFLSYHIVIGRSPLYFKSSLLTAESLKESELDFHWRFVNIVHLLVASIRRLRHS